MIFGRSPNLVLGAFTALFNVAVLAHVLGFAPTTEVVGAVNIAAGAVVALVANAPSFRPAPK